VEPASGPVKYAGDAFVAAVRFGASQVNKGGGVLGRAVEIVPADSELKADVATRRANDLVFAEKVDLLGVGTSSLVGKAVSLVAHQHKKVFIGYGTVTAELTGAEFVPTTFRTCLNTDQHAALLAMYFSRLAPRKFTRLYLLNPDYNFGHAAAAGFKRTFNRIRASGQQIVGEEYHPLQKIQDFGPYITKIMASGAEAVVTGSWGQDLRLLLTQGAALGWKVKLGSYVLDDPVVLQAVGSVAVGHVTSQGYLITVDTPENKDFLRAWRAAYPDVPIGHRYPVGFYGIAAWSILWAAEVIGRAGSLETEALIKAWEGAKFRTAWGEVEMRACDHQTLMPGFVGEITEPGKIPPAIRFYPDFPSVGPPTMIPREEITVPPRETGNPRCV
jgi:branched-chain amino acid transport system substrate-binding protein